MVGCNRERTGPDRRGAETAEVSGSGGARVPAGSHRAQRAVSTASLRELTTMDVGHKESLWLSHSEIGGDKRSGC
jgi:hypothetical protein